MPLLRVLLVLLAAAATVRPGAAFEIPAQNASGAPDPLSVAPGELVLAIVIMRHGDRTPQRHAPAFAAGDRSSYVGDRFPIDYTDWPVDYGQLTRLGMAQTREIGRRLRLRYMVNPKGESRSFLSQQYNHAETHVRSTDVDRTLVSAMNTMLGLYDDDDDEDDEQDDEKEKKKKNDDGEHQDLTPDDLGAQLANDADRTPKKKQHGAAYVGTHQRESRNPIHVVVPVHTVEYKTDALMDGSSRFHCPRFFAAGKYMLQTGFCRGAVMRNTELLAALPALTGRDTRGLAFEQLVELIAAVRDLRVYQRAHNVSQPENVTRFDSALDDIVARVSIAKWDITGLGVLVGGRLLRAIANRMLAVKDLINGDATVHLKSREECNAKGSDSDEDGSCPRKLVLYVGHDTTIFDVRAALGLHAVVDGAHGGVAPYASHIIFELRRRQLPRRQKTRNGFKEYHSYTARSAAGRDGEDEDADTENLASTSVPASPAEYVVSVLHGSHRQPTLPSAGPFCGGHASCSMERFLEYVNSRMPTDVDEACGLMTSSTTVDGNGERGLLRSPIALGISLTVGLIAGAAAGYVARGTATRHVNYAPIEH
jgi:hypothetical protein